MEFARFRFEQMQTAGDGASVAEHLAVVRTRANIPKPLEPELPRELTYVWNSWVEMHNARGSSGFGPNPIDWPSLDAYTRLTGVDLQPWEVRAIRSIDDAYLTSWAEGQKGDGG